MSEPTRLDVLVSLGIQAPGLTEGTPSEVARTWSLLDAYAGLLARFARPRGLIGFDPAGIGDEVMRSLLTLAVLPEGATPLDVGSGAGFPGIPLSIVRGGGVLIEPRARAVAFLEHVVRELSLDVTVVRARAEECATGPLRESADAVVARAVAPPEVTAALCAPLCRPGGTVAIAAGPHLDDLPTFAFARLGLAECRLITVGPPPAGPDSLRQNILAMKKTAAAEPESDS